MATSPAFLSGESHGQRSLAGCIVHRVAKSQTQLHDRAHTQEVLVIARLTEVNCRVRVEPRIQRRMLIFVTNTTIKDDKSESHSGPNKIKQPP